MNPDDLFASEDARWKYVGDLDDKMLKGGVIVSEFASEWIRNCDVCFTNGAYLACVITAFQAIETMLRSDNPNEFKAVDLINHSNLEDALKQQLHGLRKFRNSWVHVQDPWDDEEVLADFDSGNRKLFEHALQSVRSMREVLYHDQWV
ncbi:MAG TPA: hypothetical protein VK642_10160 [Burkholderiales bacterium]|nr:hypothetical protein [Burkholderiales bacterium]